MRSETIQPERDGTRRTIAAARERDQFWIVMETDFTERLLNDADRLAAIERQGRVPDAEDLARAFHATYETLAPQYGYATREETREFNPNSANGKLMIAVCRVILERMRLGIDLAEIERRARGLADSIEENAYNPHDPEHQEAHRVARLLRSLVDAPDAGGDKQ